MRYIHEKPFYPTIQKWLESLGEVKVTHNTFTREVKPDFVVTTKQETIAVEVGFNRHRGNLDRKCFQMVRYSRKFDKVLFVGDKATILELSRMLKGILEFEAIDYFSIASVGLEKRVKLLIEDTAKIKQILSQKLLLEC